MKNLVQEQIQVTLKECGYPEDVSEYEADNELGEFLDEVRRVFKVVYDRSIGLPIDRRKDRPIRSIGFPKKIKFI